MKLSEYRAAVSSIDLAVLTQSRQLITELLAKESERGHTAEVRATTTLAASGVLAGFIIQSLSAADTGGACAPWLGVAAYAGALAFLMRGAFYCVRAMSPDSRWEIAAGLVTELQSKSPAQSMQEEIAHKLWEYERAIGPNSARLFWLSRAQRALLVSIGLFALTALGLHLSAPGHLSLTVQWAAVASLVVLFLTVDRMVEHRSIWHR
jgi:hypothetical protein